MAIENKAKPVDAEKKRARRGYSYIPQNRLIKGGKLEVALEGTIAGWDITPEELTSREDEDGFRIRLSSVDVTIGFDGGVTIRNTAIPFSGTGGMVIEHDSGNVRLEVSGDGDGLGGQQVVLANASNSVYFGIFRNLSGTTRIKMHGLPTDDTGLGIGELWNDSGTLKIVS